MTPGQKNASIFCFDRVPQEKNGAVPIPGAGYIFDLFLYPISIVKRRVKYTGLLVFTRITVQEFIFKFWIFEFGRFWSSDKEASHIGIVERTGFHEKKYTGRIPIQFSQVLGRKVFWDPRAPSIGIKNDFLVLLRGTKIVGFSDLSSAARRADVTLLRWSRTARRDFISDLLLLLFLIFDF